MATNTISVATLKRFGGIRFKNAVEGTFTDGYNFESFPAQDDGYGFRTMLGNASLDELEDYEICGVFESKQSGTKYTFIYAVDNTDGRILQWTGSAFVTKVTGLTKTAKNCNGIDFDGKFFFTNGVDNPRTIDIGATPEAVEITCTDALSRTHLGLGLWVHDNRVWMTSQYGVVSCANGDETDWASVGNAGAFYKDYTETTTAVYGFSSGIVIMGQNFAEFMSGFGTDNYSFEAIGSTGAVGHKAICSHDNKVFYFNGEGIYPITYTDTNQRRVGERITDHIDKSFKTIDKNKYADVQLLSLSSIGENKLYFHARYTNYENNSVIWILDYSIGEWFRRIQQPVNYLSINNNLLYSAGIDGHLLQENIGSTFNGTQLNSCALLALIDFGSSAQIKRRIKRLRALFSPGSSNDFYIRYIFDGDPSGYQEFLIKEELTDLVWADDDETLGGDWADDDETEGGIWDSLKTNNIQISKPTKKFFSMQIQFEARDEGQSFDIQRIEATRIKVKV